MKVMKSIPKASLNDFTSYFPPHHLPTPNDIFCNTELDMREVKAVGFEVNWCLAQYNKEYNKLIFNELKQKLVHRFNYPSEVLRFKLDRELCIKGCIVDKKRGNILKLDKHKYVRDVEHGTKILSQYERKEASKHYPKSETFEGNDFLEISTQVESILGSLFAQLVEFKDTMFFENNNQPMISTSYDKIWEAIVTSKDLLDNENKIRKVIEKDPQLYIEPNDEVFVMLKKMRDIGHKKIFLVTNSYFEYTHVVMKYLYQHWIDNNNDNSNSNSAKNSDSDSSDYNDDSSGNNNYKWKSSDGDNSVHKITSSDTKGGHSNSNSNSNRYDFGWTQYFDLIIVGANKPAFLVNDRSLPFHEVDPITGYLRNTECLNSKCYDASHYLESHGKIYQGGNAKTIHRLLDIANGDEVLYVGGHIYNDIRQSKQSIGWRTCLIVHELQHEIAKHQQYETSVLREELYRLRKTQYDVDCVIDEIVLGQQQLPQQPHNGVSGGVDSADSDNNDRNTNTNVNHVIDAQHQQRETLCQHVSLHLTSYNSESMNNANDNNNNSTSPTVTYNKYGLLSNDSRLRKLMHALNLLNDNIRSKLQQYDSMFHPRWGQVLKAGFQQSRLAKQISDYSCIYTSKVTNLGRISMTRSFHPFRDKMPHDHHVEGF